MFLARNRRRTCRGAVLVVSLIFVMVFSALAVALASLSGANVEVASSQHKVNQALHAAQSGLECAEFLVTAVTETAAWPDPTDLNYVTDDQAETAWTALCSYVDAVGIDGKTDSTIGRFSDALGDGDKLTTETMDFGAGNGQFTIEIYRYDASKHRIYVRSIGTDGQATRSVAMSMDVTKDREVLEYAIATQGRMWLTGDTTIHGDIYSSYGRKYNSSGTSYTLLSLAPFNMTSDSCVEGTVNTVLSNADIDTRSYDLETLNADDKPMFTFDGTVYDASGNAVSDSYGTIDSDGYLVDADGEPVYDADGKRVPVDYANRVYSSDDEIQAYHENVNYDQPRSAEVSGLKITDYSTSAYKAAIPTTVRSAASSLIENGHLSKSGVPTVTEYFPHAALDSGGYTTRSGSSLPLKRYIYENKTIRNVVVDQGTNALFKNCTFEGVLYVDTNYDGPTVPLPSSYTSSAISSFLSTTKNYNNTRFENCTFNGVIVTNTPQALNSNWWMGNNLYFTGEATFNNQSDVQEATILAPHFNVNIGNTNPDVGENNVLTGAIVGGIVDVRGNAEIYGTIISMADTSAYSSGYVTNIGVTLDDGGSETTEAGDVGVINITPEEDMLLPSGIKSDIIIKPDQSTYSETV
ncbi:MAG: pilus assembly PilX N-terminal domain-containing protein [Phycisphaerales bacterium]